VLVVNSAISVYYYLRVIVAMYLREEAPGAQRVLAQPRRVSLAGAVALAVLSLALVYLGLAPGALLRVIQASTTGVF
jgi:NADH-quinone oxidoreductase subunit N